MGWTLGRKEREKDGRKSIHLPRKGEKRKENKRRKKGVVPKNYAILRLDSPIGLALVHLVAVLLAEGGVT